MLPRRIAKMDRSLVNYYNHGHTCSRNSRIMQARILPTKEWRDFAAIATSLTYEHHCNSWRMILSTRISRTRFDLEGWALIVLRIRNVCGWSSGWVINWLGRPETTGEILFARVAIDLAIRWLKIKILEFLK